MGQEFSVGKEISKQLAIPSINESIDRAERGITRVTEDVEASGRELATTKNQVLDTVQFGATLAFIAIGGSLIIYGPEVFSTFKALGERVSRHGIQVGFSV